MSGLLVPADSAVPLSLCPVEDSATAISDLLGGVLLDDTHVLPLTDGTSVTIYQGEDRASLPVNDRLTVLATRLGIVDRAFHATARGDALRPRRLDLSDRRHRRTRRRNRGRRTGAATG